MAEASDNVDTETFRHLERLRALRIEHRDLDDVIHRLQLWRGSGAQDSAREARTTQCCGAEEGNRTLTPLREMDFESIAYTSSATPARRASAR